MGQTTTIKFGDPFSEDSQCDVSEAVVISLNNLSYPVFANSKKFEHQSGFMSSYINVKENVQIDIRHIKTLYKKYNDDTQCTEYVRKVAVTIKFQDSSKSIAGVVIGGCP
jgi:hypothetical protein